MLVGAESFKVRTDDLKWEVMSGTRTVQVAVKDRDFQDKSLTAMASLALVRTDDTEPTTPVRFELAMRCAAFSSRTGPLCLAISDMRVTATIPGGSWTTELPASDVRWAHATKRGWTLDSKRGRLVHVVNLLENIPPALTWIIQGLPLSDLLMEAWKHAEVRVKEAADLAAKRAEREAADKAFMATFGTVTVTVIRESAPAAKRKGVDWGEKLVTITTGDLKTADAATLSRLATLAGGDRYVVKSATTMVASWSRIDQA